MKKSIATMVNAKKAKSIDTYDEQRLNQIKRLVAESYYNLYHKDNYDYPEAQNKDAYCDMMIKRLGLNELENIKAITESTLHNNNLVEIRDDALKLHRYICELQKMLLLEDSQQEEKYPENLVYPFH